MGNRLLTEQNTPKVAALIIAVADEKFRDCEGFRTFYEHGHWWLKVETDNMEFTFDVVDANTESGIDFEMIEEKERY